MRSKTEQEEEEDKAIAREQREEEKDESTERRTEEDKEEEKETKKRVRIGRIKGKQRDGNGEIRVRGRRIKRERGRRVE